MRPQPKPTKKARLAARKRARERAIFRAAEVRHDALIRSRGRCEACGCNTAAHIHHVVSGSGRRRQRESLETVACLCVACHDDVHRNERWTLESLLSWAEDHGYVEAEAALRKRYEKRESTVLAFGRLAEKARAR